METSDITVQILRDIRDSIDNMRTELRTELGARIDDLGGRIDHMEVYLGSEIAGLRREVIALRPIGDGNALVRRVAKCETDIAELKGRLPQR